MTELSGTGARRSWLPWGVGAAVVAIAMVVGGVAFAVSARSDGPTTVQGVADAALLAAHELDVDKGIDLLCSAPKEKDREFLSHAISAARDATGVKSPRVDYQVMHILGKTDGGFDVRITSSEDALAGVVGSAHVNVAHRGDRSCITGLDHTSIEQEGDGHLVVK